MSTTHSTTNTPGKSPWKDGRKCGVCDATLGFLSNRRHHCRYCGMAVCHTHSKNNMIVAEVSTTEPARVCDICFSQRPQTSKREEAKAAFTAPTVSTNSVAATPPPPRKVNNSMTPHVPPAPAAQPAAAITGEELYSIFIQKSKDVKNAKNPTDNEKLEMYSYYKYVVAGPCNTPKPGMFDPVGRAKWNAYNGVKDKPREEVMWNYIDLVDRLLGLPKESRRTGRGGAAGAVVGAVVGAAGAAAVSVSVSVSNSTTNTQAASVESIEDDSHKKTKRYQQGTSKETSKSVKGRRKAVNTHTLAQAHATEGHKGSLVYYIECFLALITLYALLYYSDQWLQEAYKSLASTFWSTMTSLWERVVFKSKYALSSVPVPKQLVMLPRLWMGLEEAHKRYVKIAVALVVILLLKRRIRKRK